VKTRLLVGLFVLSMLVPYMLVIFRALSRGDHLNQVLPRIADRHNILEKGRMVWSRGSAELRAAADVQREYLGL
jgi:ABC-type branched-subunit amino acid transport system ATPase component